jgi:hypothetical protein
MSVIQQVYDQEAVERFFWFARERHAIYLRRRAGRPRPWTEDAILNTYSITNVYRELDKTTVWYRQNVRERYDNTPLVLLATVVFRWFNTMRTGETLFCQPSMLTGKTPFEEFAATGDTAPMLAALSKQEPPYVTGAYMIRSPDGMEKMPGILHCIERFNRTGGVQAMADYLAANRGTATLKATWEWLKEFYGQGPFIAYEVITDLRHTYLLNQAPDIMTWANPGPGALRGANLLLGRVQLDDKGRLKKASYKEAHRMMADMLKYSQDPRYWPQENGRGDFIIDTSYAEQLKDVMETAQPGDWPAWDMREPEMWSCEYTKYERTRRGYGRPRGTYP